MPSILTSLLVAAAAAAASAATAGRRGCRLDILERDLAKELAGELRSSATRWGCEYSGAECTFEEEEGGGGGAVVVGGGRGGYVRGSCRVVKGPADGEDARSCRPELLEGELQRDFAKDVAKAKRKFGCEVDTLSCSTAANGRVECAANGAVNAGARARAHARARAPAAGGGCDLSILTASVENELAESVRKAQHRYACPVVTSVECEVEPGSNWVDCSLAISSEASVPANCDMDWLTADASKDVAEELVEASGKYGCKVPPHVTCTEDRGHFNCVLGQRSTMDEDAPPAASASDSASGSADAANADTRTTGGHHDSVDAKYKRKWTHRHMRGHSNL